MVGLTNLLRRFVGVGRRTIRECRRCGTTVAGDTEDCPTCGSGEIATYRLEG